MTAFVNVHALIDTFSLMVLARGRGVPAAAAGGRNRRHPHARPDLPGRMLLMQPPMAR